jgi:hypothetical protein
MLAAHTTLRILTEPPLSQGWCSPRGRQGVSGLRPALPDWTRHGARIAKRVRRDVFDII